MIAAKKCVGDCCCVPTIAIHLGIVVTGFNKIPPGHVGLYVIGVASPIEAWFIVRHCAWHILSGQVIFIITVAGCERCHTHSGKYRHHQKIENTLFHNRFKLCPRTACRDLFPIKSEPPSHRDHSHNVWWKLEACPPITRGCHSLNNSKPLYASPSGSWRNTGTASAHQYSLAKVQNINEKRRKKLGKCLAILKKISIFAADNAYKAIRG